MPIRTQIQFSLFAWTATIKVTFEPRENYFEYEILSFQPLPSSVQGTFKRLDNLDLFDELTQLFENDSKYIDFLVSFQSEFIEDLGE
jgi:hypothetical protein